MDMWTHTHTHTHTHTVVKDLICVGRYDWRKFEPHYRDWSPLGVDYRSVTVSSDQRDGVCGV